MGLTKAERQNRMMDRIFEAARQPVEISVDHPSFWNHPHLIYKEGKWYVPPVIG